MKLYAYEVRQDEQAEFERMAQTHQIEIKLDSSVPSLENADRARGFHGITILGQGRLDEALLSRYQHLGIRFLSTRTIGYNHIDLEAAGRLKIQVCNASYAPDGVADFTVMMMLMCLRHYKQAMWRGQVNDFSLPGLLGQNMSSLTVGIMGTGRIGTRVIQNLSGFGCKILAYSSHERKEVKQYAQYVDLDTLFTRSDIISLHMPLTPSTWHIINRETIGKMKEGVIIINCARGELTDIDALVDGIESRKIGALGMDTVEGEEGIIHGDHRVDILSNRNWFYLHQFRNVIMTQHMAFYTKQAVDSMVRCGVEGILQMNETGRCPTLLQPGNK